MKATLSMNRETALQSVIALAERVLEFTTSTTTIVVLGIVATFAVLAAVANDAWTTFTTVAVIAFALVMAISMTVDIEEGGVS